MARRKKYPYLYNIPKGSSRFYLWAGKGHPRYRVDPHAPNFDQVYGNFRAGIVPKIVQPESPKPTKSYQLALLQFYKASPYITWKPDRKRQIRGLLDEMAEEQINPERPDLGKVGDLAIDRFRIDGLRRLVDRKIEKSLYGAALQRSRALRIFWGWLHENGLVNENIALRLKAVKIPKSFQRRHTITDEEIRRYREYWPYGTKERLGFELGMAGVRCGDLVLLGPQHLVERNGVQFLEYYTQKSLNSNDEPELAIVEVHEELALAIDQYVPTRKDKKGNTIPVIGNTTFLVTEKGPLAYTAQHYGSRKVFKAWCKKAGLPSRVTTHSLRRGAAAGLAHRGASHEEINTAQGRAPGSRVISVYLRDIDKRRIADLAAARKRRES